MLEAGAQELVLARSILPRLLSAPEGTGSGHSALRRRSGQCRTAEWLENLDLRPNLIHQNLRRRIAGIHFAFDDNDLPDGQLVARFLPGLREEHKLDIALNIFDGDKAHRLVGLGRVRTDRGDETRHAHLFFVLRLAQADRRNN